MLLVAWLGVGQLLLQLLGSCLHPLWQLPLGMAVGGAGEGPIGGNFRQLSVLLLLSVVGRDYLNHGDFGCVLFATTPVFILFVRLTLRRKGTGFEKMGITFPLILRV